MELNIPEGFFDGEIRDSFYVEKLMKKNWACMIKVISEIDRICRKYDIKYFADWGTLLGAARHKGFIPWDDDVDICMLRPDYERFAKVAESELPKDWKFLSIYTDRLWRKTFSRVVTGSTVNYEQEHMSEFYGFPFAAGVDIFPNDYVAPLKDEEEYVRYAERIVLHAAECCEKDVYTEKDKEDMLTRIEQMCRVRLDRGTDMVNQLYKLNDKLAQMYGADESSRVALLPDCQSMRKECFSDVIMLDFEYIKIPAPVCYEEVLVCEFGEDWRTPRIVAGDHDYPYYKRQKYLAWEKLGKL
jgi:lipopolysaccharide cholinephosphotransferase